MAETGMWGAPAGIIAGQQMDNQRLKTRVEAQETMGRIAAQPGENLLRQAQARAANALAGQNEAESVALAIDKRFSEGYGRASQGALAAAGGAAGPLGSPTVYNMGAPSDALIAEANWLILQPGAPRARINKLLETATEMRQKEASREKQLAEADREIAQTRKLEQDAMLQGIQYAGSSPQAHANSWRELNAKGAPLADALNGDFMHDRRVLAQYALGSLTEDQKIDNAVAAEKLKLDKIQTQTQKTNAITASKVATKRVELMDVQVDALRLAGGNGTVEAEVAGDALRYAKHQKLVTDREKEFPAAYRNSDKLKVGQTYTLKDSSLGRLEVDPKTGVKSWAIIKPALVAPPTPRTREQVLAGRRAILATTNSTGD